MISRWVTSFRAAVVLWSALVPSAWSATVSGKIELLGSKDLSGVVVWLDRLAAPPQAPANASMAHKNKTFLPHVLAVQTGTKVSFPNLDPFFHNAFSNYGGQVFDIGLHPPGSAREVTFRRAGIVRLFCNIHPTMSAVIVVLDTPWFAVSNAKGEFKLDGVPPGDYRLRVFHERALPEGLTSIERQVTVITENMLLSPIAISETGYLAPPHKNKYGKDYPAIIVDQYPGRIP